MIIYDTHMLLQVCLTFHFNGSVQVQCIVELKVNKNIFKKNRCTLYMEPFPAFSLAEDTPYYFDVIKKNYLSYCVCLDLLLTIRHSLAKPMKHKEFQP